MEEETKIELERAKLTNYILQKENEILLGTIGNLANEKQQMLSELEKYRQSISYKMKRKVKNGIKKIIRRK